MKKIQISNSEITGFVDEVDFHDEAFDIKDIKSRRVSHIRPENILLNILFRLIRHTSKDNSPIANWTRTWRCTWQVEIGNHKMGGFKQRQGAISYEKNHIIKNGLY